MSEPPSPLASARSFPAIAKHGVIGDRRTGALVAAGGSIDWFCTPDFDGTPVFGTLLDPERGGFCRFGPRENVQGKQRYLPGTVAVVTTWDIGKDAAALELTDVMAWPDTDRPDELAEQRVIIRRLRVVQDSVVQFDLHPRRGFTGPPDSVGAARGGAVFTFADGTLGFWASFEVKVEQDRVWVVHHLRAGEEHWAVVGWNTPPEQWSVARAAAVFGEAQAYWSGWSAGLKLEGAGERAAAVERSALTVQLLSHVTHESAVAALTTSLPERLGGDKNYDYRYAWVRDASLSLALLARGGKTAEVQCYLRWLCSLTSSTPSPLQVCYRLNGDPNLDQTEIEGVRGYEDSRPVFLGNRAAKQRQLGSLGFFVDCARIYVDHGGEWREEFWALVKRVADFTSANWQEKDCGVWELSQEAHYVASRVMSWVVLERATDIAGKTGHAGETDHWRETAAAIHAEVMEKGWCARKNSFRQRYDSDALDAAALLIPLMNFLPADHPRVLGTLAATERELVVDGLVHRFDPSDTMGGEQLPIAEFEGAFLPCVFWHAHALAKAGRCAQAEAILVKCEAVAGELGLFAEEIDARKNTFLGNTPLLFSHVEYTRAVMALNEARATAARTGPKAKP